VDDAGDTAEVTKLMGILERNGRGGIQVRPQKDVEGNRLQTMVEELDAATKWGTSHFAETSREKDREWTNLMDAGLAAISKEDITDPPAYMDLPDAAAAVGTIFDHLYLGFYTIIQHSRRFRD
jgi:hypothetical protein